MFCKGTYISSRKLASLREDFVDLNEDGDCCDTVKDYLSYKDNFYIQGGIAESLFSIGNFVIGGFSNGRGCYMALLDSYGTIIGNLTFADGYSVESISYSDSEGLLALAVRNNGTLLYEWNETLSVNFLGVIDSGEDNFVYDVKISDNNIYTASENGISIYQIER